MTINKNYSLQLNQEEACELVEALQAAAILAKAAKNGELNKTAIDPYYKRIIEKAGALHEIANKYSAGLDGSRLF